MSTPHTRKVKAKKKSVDQSDAGDQKIIIDTRTSYQRFADFMASFPKGTILEIRQSPTAFVITLPTPIKRNKK